MSYAAFPIRAGLRGSSGWVSLDSDRFSRSSMSATRSFRRCVRSLGARAAARRPSGRGPSPGSRGESDPRGAPAVPPNPSRTSHPSLVRRFRSKARRFRPSGLAHRMQRRVERGSSRHHLDHHRAERALDRPAPGAASERDLGGVGCARKLVGATRLKLGAQGRPLAEMTPNWHTTVSKLPSAKGSCMASACCHCTARPVPVRAAWSSIG